MSAVFGLFGKKVQALAHSRFPRATPIQQEAIPRILSGKSVLLISETGSGKTESVLLPVFDLFLKKDHTPISILYITPLKSLNRDLLQRLLWWGKELDFDVSVRHGDTTPYERSMQAQNPSDLLISTPETLQSMLVGKIMRTHLAHVKWVVIDEIHELVGNKRGVQLAVGLERLRRLAGDFQVVGLSATVGSPEKVASFLGDRIEIINAAREKELRIEVDVPAVRPEDHLSSKKIMVSPETAARVRAIGDVIAKQRSVLVFTNTRESAEVLSSRLKAVDPRLAAGVHHSSLSKETRIAAERDFRDQKLKALLCTSSLELGIDIGTIDFVLQYLSPRQVMKLLQRVGRAGHSMGRISSGLVLAGDADDCFESTIIAQRALGRQIEETPLYEKARDVLGHQIVGLTLEGEIEVDKAYQLIRRAAPYRTLSPGEFFEVCRLMERLRVLWINDKDQAAADRYRSGAVAREDRFKGKKSSDLVLRRRKNAWVYYYQNLSTIPDVRSFKIHDVYANQPVGHLDAEFIALHGSPGQGFIVKGQAWRILDVSDREVMVEPMAGIEAAIPAWEGELIPVPFEVAQGVGQLRREIAAHLEQGTDPVAEMTARYPCSAAVARRMVASVKQALEQGPLPTDRRIVLEYDPDQAVIHTCFGSLVNDTLGRVLSVMLAPTLGSVGLQTDPYRIVLKTAGWREAAETFLNLRADQVEKAVLESVPGTELFHWRFLHVAKRLGIIARDAEFGKGYLKKVVEAYRGTPAWEEAMNEIVQDKLDIERTKSLLQSLRKKGREVLIREGISSLGRSALQKRHEIIAPDRPETEIFEIFKTRLLDTKVGMVCVSCGKWATIQEVREIPREVSCARCGAKLIAVVPKRYILEAQQLVQKKVAGKKLAEDEQRWLDMTIDTANLVLSSGQDAAIALAGRGVGVRTAGRILAKLLEGDELIREILKAERTYIKTRRFWKG